MGWRSNELRPAACWSWPAWRCWPPRQAAPRQASASPMAGRSRRTSGPSMSRSATSRARRSAGSSSAPSTSRNATTKPSAPRDVVLTPKAWTRPGQGQQLGQRQHQADHRPRSLGRGRALELSRRRLRRLRGLRAAQAPHADAGRLAARGAADHRGARQEGRRPRRAHGQDRQGRVHSRQPGTAKSCSGTRPATASSSGSRRSDPNIWVALGDPQPRAGHRDRHAEHVA